MIARNHLIRKSSCMAVLMLVLYLTSTAVPAAQNTAQTSWRRYVNTRWNFCANYPSTWHKNEGLDGSGANVYPDATGDPVFTSGITIGGIANQLFESPDESRLPTLEEHFASSVEALKKWPHVTNLEILHSSRGVFHGHPSLMTRIKYVDAEHGVDWIREEESIEYPRGATFSVVLQCPPGGISRLQPIFDRIVANVRLQCNQ